MLALKVVAAMEVGEHYMEVEVVVVRAREVPAKLSGVEQYLREGGHHLE